MRVIAVGCEYSGVTTLLSALTAVANNPTVKRLGKKAAKQAVDKAADFAKSKVSNSLGREAIEEAERAAKAMIGDGRRMHGMGHSGGVRLSGRGSSLWFSFFLVSAWLLAQKYPGPLQGPV